MLPPGSGLRVNRIAVRSGEPKPRRNRTRAPGSTIARKAFWPASSRTQVEAEGTSTYTVSLVEANATRGADRSQPPVRSTTAHVPAAVGESIQVDSRTRTSRRTSRGQSPTRAGASEPSTSSSATRSSTAAARSASKRPRASLALEPWL